MIAQLWHAQSFTYSAVSNSVWTSLKVAENPAQGLWTTWLQVQWRLTCVEVSCFMLLCSLECLQSSGRTYGGFMDLVWFRIWLSSLRFPIPNGRCYALLRIRDASLDTVGALLVLQQPFQELETIPCASQGTSCDQPAGHKHRDQHWLKGMKTAAPRVMIHPRILIWGCHMPASNPLDATVVTCKKIEHDCFEDDVYIYIYIYI